jgi:hypothetical protein
MDKFEKFVSDHQEEFDAYEPSPNLWEKIDPSRRPVKRNYSWIWKAAIILLVFCASYLADRQIRSNGSFASKKQEMIVPELAEAEKYYTGLIKTKMNEVQPYLVAYPEIKKDLRMELAELDKIYKGLKNDLKDNVSNEEVIDAMIQNFRLKLQLLEEIQRQLQSHKSNSKQPSHEL